MTSRRSFIVLVALGLLAVATSASAESTALADANTSPVATQ